MNGTKTDVNRWLDTFIATDIQKMNRKCFTYGLIDAFYRDNFLPLGLGKGCRSRNPKVNAVATIMP